MLAAQIGSGINKTININSSHSRIIGIKTYNDALCTQKTMFVDWGELRPGQTRTVNVYVKNVGNTWQQWIVTTQNWQPPQAQHYLSFKTNYLQTWTVPQDTLQIQLSLTVSPQTTNVTRFSFDIVVSGT